MCLKRFDENYDFKVPQKQTIKKFLDWYMYKAIGAENYVSKPPIKELRNLELVGYDFSNMDLYGIKFSNCNLSNCSFSNSNLCSSIFLNCIICNGVFDNAVLENSVFSGCKLTNTSFRGCYNWQVWFPRCININCIGMIPGRDRRAIAIACEPLYHGLEDVVSAISCVNRAEKDFPDFSYYSLISSAEFPYRDFLWIYRLYDKFRHFCCEIIPKNKTENHETGYLYDDFVFHDVELSSSFLNNNRFVNCLFLGVRFTGDSLKNVVFERCGFEYSDFTETGFLNVAFRGCLLFEPVVRKAFISEFKQQDSLYINVSVR